MSDGDERIDWDAFAAAVTLALAVWWQAVKAAREAAQANVK